VLGRTLFPPDLWSGEMYKSLRIARLKNVQRPKMCMGQYPSGLFLCRQSTQSRQFSNLFNDAKVARLEHQGSGVIFLCLGPVSQEVLKNVQRRKMCMANIQAACSSTGRVRDRVNSATFSTTLQSPRWSIKARVWPGRNLPFQVLSRALTLMRKQPAPKMSTHTIGIVDTAVIIACHLPLSCCATVSIRSYDLHVRWPVKR
jgi:hypothetical protein